MICGYLAEERSKKKRGMEKSKGRSNAIVEKERKNRRSGRGHVRKGNNRLKEAVKKMRIKEMN